MKSNDIKINQICVKLVNEWAFVILYLLKFAFITRIIQFILIQQTYKCQAIFTYTVLYLVSVRRLTWLKRFKFVTITNLRRNSKLAIESKILHYKILLIDLNKCIIF